MKIVCTSNELLNILSVASTLISDKSPYSALQYVLLQTRGNGELQVMATDLEVSLCHVARDVDVLVEGAALLPGARTVNLLREVRDERIELTATERGVEITAPGCHFKLLAEPADNFPTIPTELPAQGTPFEVPLATFQGMIGRTAFAASREETRYALNGVLFNLDDGLLRLAATDGKRLAVTENPVDFRSEQGIHVIIPLRGLEVLRRLLSEEAEQARLVVDGANLLVATERVLLSCRLIEGQFPSLQEVLARNYSKRMELNAAAFASALRRAALFTTRDTRAVRFSFSLNRLVLSSQVAEVGDTTVELDLDYPFEPVDLAFNPKFFLDALGVLGDGVVVLEAESTATSVKLTCPGFKYVVMPITLR